ncbi:MAG: prolipoprotein diacylglyceryl transferase [Bacteroidetes bacterium]|nr:prolipoprotein diacylglyceryl transferase [Bacteroidota bacterium]MBS1976156.1 prolipoprotein diacylglyceryl transferase [Bacteroidota bacterium]
MEKLQSRWKVKSIAQVVMILIVFALTGFTVVFLKKPVLTYFFEGTPRPLWATVVYYILILPVYNAILLLYGLLLGQFRFFWDFEKRMLNRIFGRTKKNTP